MAPEMEPIWNPNLPDFWNYQNLDFDDPSYSLEGSRISELEPFCILFQPFFLRLFWELPWITFWRILASFGHPNWLQNWRKIVPKPCHDHNVAPKGPSGPPTGASRISNGAKMGPQGPKWTPNWYRKDDPRESITFCLQGVGGMSKATKLQQEQTTPKT